MERHVKRRGSFPLKRSRSGEKVEHFTCQSEIGTGEPKDPYRSVLRTKPNATNCVYCPSSKCCCQLFHSVLDESYGKIPLKRQTEITKRRDLCAKSILPEFVARIVRITKTQQDTTFYDFGCGNGSVLFQVAYSTGAKCVGFEINPVNAKLAQETWALIKPKLEKKCGRSLNVVIQCVDFCEYLQKNPSFFLSPCVIWAANLLLPPAVNHYLSEQFRRCAPGTQVLCFEDFYPHGRALARLRDPEAFDLFEMKDYVWSPFTVEWTSREGKFYYFKRV